MKLWHVTLPILMASAYLVVLRHNSPTTKKFNSLSQSASLPSLPVQGASIRHYPINTNQPPATNYFIPLRWDTNQLVGKTSFDVQESHDLKAWKTILTNVTGQPWVTNTGTVTYWRVVAR